MTSITGFTALLLSDQMGLDDVRQRDFVMRVQSNVERMNDLLAQLIEMTNYREQTANFDPALVNLYTVTETAVHNVLSQVRQKNLRLDIDLMPDLPSLPADFHELGQVINSLLHNACQASRSEGHIVLSAETNSIPSISKNGHDAHHDDPDEAPLHYLHLRVSDTGSGIEPVDLPRVFEVHEDGDAPSIEGLGSTPLAQARQLVEGQGGRIWVESEVGVGSTFSVLLPLVD